MSKSPELQLLTADAVAERIGFSRMTLHRWVKRGLFPAPIYCAPRVPRWRADEIESWIERLSNKRDDSAQAAA